MRSTSPCRTSTEAMRSVWRYKAEAAAEHKASSSSNSCSVHSALKAAVEGRLGVTLSGAGFGAAYQLGAAQVLQELGLLGPHTPVAGASAGSIVAVSTRCSLPPLEVMQALNDIAQDLLQHGEAKRYRHVLREHMQGLLPPNAYQLCSSGSSSSRAFSSSSSSSSLGGCCGSSHPRYHIVTSRQAVQPVTSGCSGGSGGNPAGTHTGGASNNKTDSNSSSSTGGQPAANHEAPAGQQQQQQVGVGSAGHSSGSNGSNAPCVLGATRVRACCSGCLQPDVFMGDYASNDELLDVLLAGAHIPRKSDGTWWARLRGHRYVDAGVRDPCPPVPGVAHTIIIYPVPRQLLRRVWPYKLLLKPPAPEAVAISAGQHGRTWPYNRSYKESNHLVMHPLPSGTLNMLFERGRRDALAWVQHSSLTTELVQQLKARNQWQQQQQQQQQQPVAQQPAAALDAPSSTAQAAGTQAEAAPVLGGVAAEGSSNPKGVREGDAAVALLHMHVDELPLLLPVPQDLLHFL